ncbi:hypothetical protein [Winogradskyella alexanderae]|uniref:Uncharacterized protein n=1 Tax=Winogradskyella alexanderae TaxID=2877123 RepID=A0ABS7XMU1_9FLAO|nr:hypothetical protein [Winogradskyella alexanderae]MCA0131320.1 hypothetical protein [Winogradskyella alexanderae]
MSYCFNFTFVKTQIIPKLTEMNGRAMSKLTASREIKLLFINFFDYVVFRKFKEQKKDMLLAKLMIRELGIDLQTNQLFLILKDCKANAGIQNLDDCSSLTYQRIIDEVYARLISNKVLPRPAKTNFVNCFKLADVHSKVLTSAPNQSFIKLLTKLKNKGFKLYCYSESKDNYQAIKDYIETQGLQHLFEDVLMYDAKEAKAQKTLFFQRTLDEKAVTDEETLVISKENKNWFNELGVTPTSLETNSTETLKSLPEFKEYQGIVDNLYRACNNKSAPCHSDYILFYYVYIERLYKKAKRDNIKNICFLAREGLFLKKLFDHYQNQIALDKDNLIKSHYFKASRNSLMLASFKDIKEEKFEYLRRRWPNLSVDSFLKNFNFPKETKEGIVKAAGLENSHSTVIEGFLDTETFSVLKRTPEFVIAYNKTRHEQKKYFEAYLNSFNLDIKTEGIHLADIGWVGTMQNRLYEFFNHEIKVNGYYLGLREVHKIKENNLKYGLNFSLYPEIDFFDYILKANVELNEQLLAAGHGSTIAYTSKKNGYTIEEFEESEKRWFKKYIGPTQEFMFERFKELTQLLKNVCYDYNDEQYVMADYALKIGLFADKRKVMREVKIYEGFYENVGNFSVGLAFGQNLDRAQKIELFKNFFIYPEKAFRYVLRLKPMLLRREMYFLAYFIPTYLIYYYIRFRMKRKGLIP